MARNRLTAGLEASMKIAVIGTGHVGGTLGGAAAACGTVDALLPLWFALVQHSGGNRRVALRIAR
jgi:hypothetical protein